jgi:P-type Ca2+ transporter type 2C
VSGLTSVQHAEGKEVAPRSPLVPHASSAEEMVAWLKTDASAGLTAVEANVRLAAFGPNRLTRQEQPAYLVIALRQAADPLVGLLAAAAVVSGAVGEGLQAAVIGAIVVLNGVLGYVQEADAEREILALREALSPVASVIRDGREREVPAGELVQGDVVILREGDRVPADARLVVAPGVQVDESSLTGESVPVEKGSEPVPPSAPLAERASMAFAGTAVTRGRATAIVTATGDATELGRVAQLTETANPPATPFQRRLRQLTRVMVVLGVTITLALTGAMLLRGSDLQEAFLVGVAVAVAAVPEGLAATMTVALALGAGAMARRGAIVRRLRAVETLGSTTVIASDKTGTLTENSLRLARVWPAPGEDESSVLAAAILASTAEVVGDEAEEFRVVGDPVDGAFVIAGLERGIMRNELQPGPLLSEVPFDPERRRAAMVYQEDDGARLVAKGAPEVMIECAAGPPELLASVEARAEEWAREGLRVLAVADRVLARPLDEQELDRNLRPLGLVALHDPLRASAADSVRAGIEAGIEVRILTGDHPATAEAIGRELSLSPEAVFARVTPADKLELVRGLQEAGETVAVTGDGVNDAPALRQADVGIAMGRSGTEAAREAADIVLTDDDFSTIVAAIREGRRVGDNIRKFVAFLLSANLGEVLLFAVAISAGLGAPLTVVQVLVVNLLTDGLPAVALSRDPESPDAMTRGPLRGDRLFSPRLWAALVGIGILVGVVATAAFVAGRAGADGSEQTMAFVTLAVAELILVFCIRAVSLPLWRVPRNRYLESAVLASILILVAAVYVPFLHEPLGTVSLGTLDLATALALAVLPAAFLELAKARRALLR